MWIMSRAMRVTLGGYVYHVLNRANGRLRIFRKHDDFLAFEQVMAEAIELFNMRLCGYCIMSNHWHFLLWPHSDGDWQWSSLAIRKRGESLFELSDGPVELPGRWEKIVNEVDKEKNLEKLESSMKRGTPFGNVECQSTTAKKLKLESTIRPRGRPIKFT